MKKWNYFPQQELRVDVPEFDETQRVELELLVAEQVATLLRDYGIISDIEVDVSPSPDAEELATYTTLEVEPMELLDDCEIQVHQVPYCHDKGGEVTFNTSPGAHAVTVENQDGMETTLIGVWDPAVMVGDGHRVHHPNGSEVPLDMLQELYETLVNYLLVIQIVDDVELRHEPSNADGRPHKTEEFPYRTTDPEFDNLVSGFYD